MFMQCGGFIHEDVRFVLFYWWYWIWIWKRISFAHRCGMSWEVVSVGWVIILFVMDEFENGKIYGKKKTKRRMEIFEYLKNVNESYFIVAYSSSLYNIVYTEHYFWNNLIVIMQFFRDFSGSKSCFYLIFFLWAKLLFYLIIALLNN